MIAGPRPRTEIEEAIRGEVERVNAVLEIKLAFWSWTVRTDYPVWFRERIADD